MSYYRTLGESSSAIFEEQRRRALRRQVTIESTVMLLTAVGALAVAGRVFYLDALMMPWFHQLISALRAHL